MVFLLNLITNFYEIQRIEPAYFKNGWKLIRKSGSHVIFEKNGIHYTATFHGSKEVGKGLEMKIKKEMGLK